MKNLSEFTKYIAPDVPGCPSVLIERELLNAAQEFCQDTWILNADATATITTDDIDTTNNNSVDVNISGTDDGTAVFPITFPITFGGTADRYRPFALDGFTIDGVKKDLTYWQNVVHNQYLPDTSVKYFYFKSDGIITFFPFSTGCEIWVKYIYKPLKSVTQLDDMLFEDYLDPILSNIKSRLFNMPMKTWTNPGAAQLEYSKYRRHTARIKALRNNSFQNISSHVQWRSFGE